MLVWHHVSNHSIYSCKLVQCAKTLDKTCLPVFFLLVFDALPEFNTRAATWTFPAFQLITAVWWLLSKRVLDQHLVCQTGGYTHASLLNTLLRVCS